MIVRDVTQANVSIARSFLEGQVETSLFLLSCLDQFGPALGPHQNSGNYRVLESGGAVAAVFSLTRRGHLLAQTKGRTDLADKILAASAGENIRIDGVVAEWEAAASFWTVLSKRPGFSPSDATKSVVYKVQLPTALLREARDNRARALVPDDFEPWDELMAAFLGDEHALRQRDPDVRRATFLRRATAGYWWGAFDGTTLVAIAGVDGQPYRTVGQIGGFYTRPEYRRRGFGRSLLSIMMRELGLHHGLESLVLFAHEENTVARRFYEQFGFTPVGHFGLCFGKWE